MSQPLFVNFNEEFMTRMQTEAGSSALLTPSYLQGLRWISDPEVAISGIYLNPNDSSYSALRFLGVSLIQRPATPIFILDEEGDFSAQNFTCLADKFNIKGTFQGKKSYL